MTAIARTQTVEGWVLGFTEGEEEPLAHDLELARRAGLADVHKIRPVMDQAERDGEVVVLRVNQDPLGARDLNLPRIYEVTSKQPMPGGRGFKTVSDFYYTEEAAVLVAMRLRASGASELRRQMARVFVAYRRGLLAAEPIRIDETTVSSARIGELPLLRAEVAHEIHVVHLVCGISKQRILGRLRSQGNAKSVYWISAHLAPEVLKELRSWSRSRTFPVKRDELRRLKLIAAKKQANEKQLPLALKGLN